MIVEMKKRIRKPKFQTYKIIGKKKYELHYTDREKLEKVNILLGCEGKLATNIGNVFGDGTPIKRREVSFNKLPDTVKKQVVKCIEHIEKCGTPMENDKSVFSY